MKKVWFTSSVFLLTALVIYAIYFLSTDNKCSWVRVYECKKIEKKYLVKQSNPIYNKLRKTSDLFLKDCNPKITTTSGSYLADYSKCDLKVDFYKNGKNWVKNVEVNKKQLTKQEIKSKFKKWK